MQEKMNETYTFRRGLTVKNRLVVPPMTVRMSYFDGIVTGDELQYYGMRTGGAGLFITGVANVTPNGMGWTGEEGVYADYHIPGLSKLASTIQRNGTKAILQIFHAGRMTNTRTIGEQPVAPSAVASARPGSETPRELKAEEIEGILKDFEEATKRAIKAGFDGVEIHGANHYLIHQFFSPHSNRRNDEWGGNLEKRARFLFEVVDRVTKVVDESGVKDFIVGYRFSPREETDPGFNLKETLWLVDRLADKPLDYLHVSLTNYDGKTNLSEYQEKSMVAYIHETIKGRMPLISVGNIHTKSDVENALKDSELAAAGTAVLIDPKWFDKILEGKEKDIRTFLPKADHDVLMISTGTFGFMKMKTPDLVEK